MVNLVSLVSVPDCRGGNLDPLWTKVLQENFETGVYVLEKGEESLLARAWLTDWAKETIDVQYFIWSTDNVGILAAEALLRAAERGVRVRVIVDDLLVDAPPESLIALASHPNVHIRIYNPVHKTGISKARRIFNLLSDFRNANQRMHDKTFTVDSTFAITGGRNMADEYFDYDQKYNFRDRDILVMGGVVGGVQDNFENFWESSLAVPVEKLLAFQKKLADERRIREVYSELHEYARLPENFAPEVRRALQDLPQKFPLLLDNMVWTEAVFLHDMPGKNLGKEGLGGGGKTTYALAESLRAASRSVLIQSPYLVLPDGALELFRDLVKRGVDVRIVTNSLGATDNLMAFSGYRKQREEILAAGVKVFEFKPHPPIQKELIERYPALAKNSPIFAIHAKTMVIDDEILFVGTFNLDPRSANLNTEVGVLLENRKLAEEVAARIRSDMAPENSWPAGNGDAASKAPLGKRLRLRLWEMLPLDALL
jgi:cardiolipin synthase C